MKWGLTDQFGTLLALLKCERKVTLSIASKEMA
jgi:hypothetical protein